VTLRSARAELLLWRCRHKRRLSETTAVSSVVAQPIRVGPKVQKVKRELCLFALPKVRDIKDATITFTVGFVWEQIAQCFKPGTPIGAIFTGKKL
jgi:hypothetical protein